MAIFLMTGDKQTAKELAQDLAYGQTLRGHDIVSDLIVWLKEARKLVTGNLHWAVWDLHEDEVAPVVAAFPIGTVIHIRCGERLSSTRTNPKWEVA